MNTTTAKMCVALKNSYPRFLAWCISFVSQVNMQYVPDSGMRKKGKPSLEYKRNDSGPVEKQIVGKMLLHIIPVDVVYDERESMQQRKQEEGICNPPVEHLESFVGYACEQGDPICLARRSTANPLSAFHSGKRRKIRQNSQNKRHTPQSQPSRPRSQRRRTTEFLTGPVVRFWREIHTEKVDSADSGQHQDPHRRRIPSKASYMEPSIRKIAYTRESPLPYRAWPYLALSEEQYRDEVCDDEESNCAGKEGYSRDSKDMVSFVPWMC